MAGWYIVHSDRDDGPYSLNELRTLLRDDELSLSATIREGTDGTPVRVSDVPAVAKSYERTCEDGSGRISMVFLSIFALVLGGAVLLTLFAVIFPALGNVKEAARRSQSQNHLHNITVALHNYNLVHDAFPPAGIVLADGTERYGWGTLLLPYVMSSPLYASMEIERRNWDDPALHSEVAMPVFMYLNPAIPEVHDTHGRAVIHYSANRHLLFINSRTRMSDITDGVADTLLFGEIAAATPPWASVRNYRDPLTGIGLSARQFGHPNGEYAQFAYADGVVRLLNAGIDPDILRKLALPNDGEEVPSY